LSGIVAKVMGFVGNSHAPSRGEEAFDHAMRTSDDLVRRFDKAAAEPDVIRDIFSEMLENRHNTPYAVTMYETHQEMIGPAKLATEAANNVHPLRTKK